MDIMDMNHFAGQLHNFTVDNGETSIAPGFHAHQCRNLVSVGTDEVFENIAMEGDQANVLGSDEFQDMECLCEALGSFGIARDNVETEPCCSGNCDTDAFRKAVYSQDIDGDTLLHSAIITLNEELAEHFIGIAPSFSYLKLSNKLKQTPLHLAVLTQQVRVVRRLMAGGADILSRDREGNTPLHLACREGYADIVRALLEPVRYLETKQNTYDIPYQRIPQDLSIKNFDGLGCLHLAAAGGHHGVVTLLLEKHADINCGDVKSGRTVLHYACVEGDLDLVKLLLRYQTCNINARTYGNLTALDLARDRGYLRITFELASAGAMAANELDTNEYWLR